jgi:hypothetical protein
VTTTQVVLLAVVVAVAALVLFKVAMRRSSEFADEREPLPLEQSRARQSMLDAFSSLDRSQQREVRKAVRWGRQVEDPSLAAAAVSLAQWKALLQREHLAKVKWLPIVWLSLLALLGVARIADRGTARPLDIIFLVGFLVLIALGIWRPKGPLRRAEKAERLNRALSPAQQPLTEGPSQVQAGPSE